MTAPTTSPGLAITVSDGPNLRGYTWRASIYGDEIERLDVSATGLLGLLNRLEPGFPVAWDARDGRSIRAEDLAEIIGGRAA